MSKTLKLTVSFPMSVVVNSETVAAVEESREALKGAKQLKGEEKAMAVLFASERTTEEILEIVMRKGIREILRKELTSELNNTETGVTVGDIKVVYAAPMAPKTSCQGCISTNCEMPQHDTNEGCNYKRTGVREQVNLPIPQTFGERIVSGWDAGDV